MCRSMSRERPIFDGFARKYKESRVIDVWEFTRHREDFHAFGDLAMSLRNAEVNRRLDQNIKIQITQVGFAKAAS
jgi:hypothetical protein